MNQSWNIDNSTLRKKLRWNLNRTAYTLIQDNAFEGVVYEMATIWSRSQCANAVSLYWSSTHDNHGSSHHNSVMSRKRLNRKSDLLWRKPAIAGGFSHQGPLISGFVSSKQRGRVKVFPVFIYGRSYQICQTISYCCTAAFSIQYFDNRDSKR